MDPSTAQFHQEMSSQTLECILACNKTQQDKKPRPADEQALKCPRCDSTNTKFCYYNNYSLTQPRYFCKSCRRYWTKGGTLRNVPVGGGYRKNKRSSSLKRTQDDPPNQNPLISTFSPFSYDSSTDLSLAFARLQSQTNGQLGYDGHPHMSMLSNPSNSQYCNTPNSGHAYLETTHNGFHNVYYGDQNVGPGFNYGGEENQMGYEESSAIVKQESNKGGIEVERRVFWGLPWQLSGDGDMSGGGGVESVRQSWNGFGSSWQGLLNSPLM